MTEILLVPGAWHGAWAWDRVVPLLAAAGHRPRPLDLPPVVDGRGAGLQDHVDHLRTIIDAAAAPPAVVAHSYAGLVAQAAVAASSREVAHLVLVDGWLGEDGDSMLDLAPSPVADRWRADRVPGPGGDVLPPPSPKFVGVREPADVALLEQRLTPQPYATFADRVQLTARWRRAPTTAIVCDPPSMLPFERWATERDLPVRRITSGHDVMITRPAELAELLREVLAGR
jgi:pimeloyl-ACP methyl ester carboxylesterase